MSDQPTTMREYRFKKLQRLVVMAVFMLGAVVFTATAGLLAAPDPGMSLLFMFGAVEMLAGLAAINNDGYARTVLNLVFRTDISDIKRPDKPATGGVADD